MSKKHLNKALLKRWNVFLNDYEDLLKEPLDTRTYTDVVDKNDTSTHNQKFTIEHEYLWEYLLYSRFTRQERRELQRHSII